jgi:hypothetical protein
MSCACNKEAVIKQKVKAFIVEQIGRIETFLFTLEHTDLMS